MTRLFHSKDSTIETRKSSGSLRRRLQSSKVDESARRKTNFTAPIGLSFEHFRSVGARGSEKKIVQWWGSAPPRAL